MDPRLRGEGFMRRGLPCGNVRSRAAHAVHARLASPPSPPHVRSSSRARARECQRCGVPTTRDTAAAHRPSLRLAVQLCGPGVWVRARVYVCSTPPQA
eukprot:scaffold4465_cov403-Prasinococcus_capsulatus_cf.AAC.4